MEDIRVIPGFLDKHDADIAYALLKTCMAWKDTLFVIGTDGKESKKIKRKMTYVSDKAVMYQYANLEFMGEEWNDLLEEIKEDVEAVTSKPYNSVLLNMYENGKDIINWHSDKEESLGDHPTIACVNLGATRKFWFREKTPLSEKFFHELSHGDLLVMGSECQCKYLHAILKEPEVTEPRISLTFRYNFTT